MEYKKYTLERKAIAGYVAININTKEKVLTLATSSEETK